MPRASFGPKQSEIATPQSSLERLEDLQRLNFLLKFKWSCQYQDSGIPCPSNGKPHSGHPEKHARDSQLPPKGQWWGWAIISGRGFGKTRTGAEYVKSRALDIPNSRIALIAPTFAKGRDAMIEGDSGIRGLYDGQGALPWQYIENYNRSIGELYLTNGSQFKIFSADDEKSADLIRGYQCSTAWFDELAAMSAQDHAWNMLEFALRLGSDPRVIVTTTPRPTKLIKLLVEDPAVVITYGSTYDNADNLPERTIARLRERYEGTTLGQQEIHGRLLLESVGALWTSELIDRCRGEVESATLSRIIVAVDPAGTGKRTSDETGIIVAGATDDGVVWILEDASGRYSPEAWASKAVGLYDDYKADAIVAETNFGADMCRAVVMGVRSNITFRSVTASRGKAVRAQPVVNLYERGRVKHAALFEELEAQMTQWIPPGTMDAEGEIVPASKESPDRLDAMVWAVFDLALKSSASRGLLRFYD